MASDELNNLVVQLSEQGKMLFLEGASEKQISDFEKKHQIQFPLQYKEWLLFSDGGEFFLPAGIQMYGVSHKPIIDVDFNDRPDNSYIVIGATAAGDPILCNKDNEEICIYNHEVNRIEPDETYPNFYAFLGNLYDLLGIGG